MEQSNFSLGATIFSKGAALSHVFTITSGSVEMVLGGKKFNLLKGDVIGLCGVLDGYYSLTYKAVSPVTGYLYNVSNAADLEKLFTDDPNQGIVMANAMSKLLSVVLKHRQDLQTEADASYSIINEIIPIYETLCSNYALSSKKLSGITDITHSSEADPLDNWLLSFYSGFKNLEGEVMLKLYQNIGITSGLIQLAASHIRVAEDSCKYLQSYLIDISDFFVAKNSQDLFAMLTELHLGSINIIGADSTVERIIVKLAKHILGMTYADNLLFKRRYGIYNSSLVKARETKPTETASVTVGPVKQNLVNSLGAILDYSGLPSDICNKFARLVHEYRLLPDKESNEEVPSRLRKELTLLFNEIYYNIALKSFQDESLPTIIKMFLNFGYVDAELAGAENSDYLYSIADSLRGDPANGIFTIEEWLGAVYIGIKDPCRNEFDMDYPAHLTDLRISGKITADEEAKLLYDKESRLRFEIENTFQVVNKLTFGRITTFCPLFTDINAKRDLESSQTKTMILKQTLQEIKDIDFSVFYRESLFSDINIGVTKETVNVEVMPNIILMPNFGSRGMMWQEIEGRKRATPARFFMPIFFQGDIKNQIIRLVGEYRWEMCKRVQGGRWQDITDLSLTSEYCDYLQFYKKNRDLSQDIKASVKQELSRARNNFKTVFISNYAEWISYESQGLPRLNKNARRIMFNYCPFKLAIRESIKLNPQFAEHIKRYEFKQSTRENQLTRLIQKLQQKSIAVPPLLLSELEFVKS